MVRREVLAFGLALTAIFGLPMAAAGAGECAFAEVKLKRSDPKAGTSGVASAVVTRVDSAREIFRVEQTVGIAAPRPRDVVRIDCGQPVQPGSSLALVLSAQPEPRWLGSPWNRPDRPAAPAPGPVAAVASGHYGDSRLVALDAAGRAVAWHRRDGRYGPAAIAACPGGRTVVTVGSGGPGYPDYDYEYAVYDLDLRLRRSASIHPTGEGPLRCLDPEGAFSQRLTNGYPDGPQLITYGGPTDTSRPVPLPDVSNAVVVPGGFLVYRPEGPVHVDRDATVRKYPKVALPARLHRLSVAPDGRTVAGTTEGSFDRATGTRVPVQVVAFDLPTGEVLGRWPSPTLLDGLAWTTSGVLLARVGYSDGLSRPQDLGRVVQLDRSLREVGALPGSAGARFGAVGDQAVFWGGAPLSRSAPGGSVSRPSALRLAATELLVGLTNGTLASDPPDGLPRIYSDPSTDRTSVGVAGGLGLMALAGAAGAAVARVRQ